jgi:hypothetical protein
MAKLREQAQLVKKLDNFYRKTGYSSEKTRQYRLANQAAGGVPEADFLGSLQINGLTRYDSFRLWLKRNNFSKKTQFLLDRRHKINRLYESCKHDGFIEIASADGEEVNGETKIIPYMRVSSKGSDLIHFTGFWEEVFKKYPTQKLIATTIITALLSGTVVVLILKVILHLFGISIS